MSILKLLYRKKWIEYIAIFAGVTLMALGVRMIYEPLELVTGGVAGFAIVVRDISMNVINGGIPVWITTAVINVPLFIIGWRLRGRDYIIKSLYATVIYTAELSVIPCVSVTTQDFVMAALYGGILTGAGLGMIVLTGSSAGGTDLLGAIMKHYFPECSIGTLLMYVDSFVVLIGAMVFGIRNALYAVIAVFITSKVMDSVINGFHYSKLVMVITENGQKLGRAVINEVGRGVTLVPVKGMYSGADRNMIICAASRRETVRIVKIVEQISPDAFVMISDIREILGEGFVKVDEYLK